MCECVLLQTGSLGFEFYAQVFAERVGLIPKTYKCVLILLKGGKFQAHLENWRIFHPNN